MKKQTKTLKAYKVFNPDWTCRGFQYEIGKSYSIKGDPIMCEKGFHACMKVSDCFSYYDFNPENKVAEVELSGIILGEDDDKQCSSKITLLKEISWNDMLSLANTGRGNSGNWNSGNSNSGDRNSGNRNSGNRNSGNSNSGNWNSGDSNSGFFNSQTPDTILAFNKPCKRDIWDNAQKPDFIYRVEVPEWISWSETTGQEKIDNKNAFVCEGYLKTLGYKEAWKKAFDSATKEDIKLLKALPNFDAKVFEEITGIKV